MTKDECLAKATEAEQLANLVSFGVDKERLRRSAREWRERAAEAGPARGRAQMVPASERASAH